MTDNIFSSRDFREALSTFATGVTIVTATSEDGEPVGMTASSFNSVSMEPPLVLWSVTKSALSAPIFKAAEHFSIHVLSSDQVSLSNRFATKGEDKFADVDWSFDERNVPVINGVATRFDCSTWAVNEGGDHWIIVGKVEALSKAGREALVFGGGSYATINPLRVVEPDFQLDSDAASPIDGLLIYQLARAYRQLGHEFHNTVRKSGLTIPEWRILASLHGDVTRSFDDLMARTFVEREALWDMLQDMSERGLCVYTGNADSVRGTPAGQERVKDLFDLGSKIEGDALSGLQSSARDELIAMLRQIISNTNDAG